MVALTDLNAMHAVDDEEIAKHEGVGPVHRVERAAAECCATHRTVAARADSPA